MNKMDASISEASDWEEIVIDETRNDENWLKNFRHSKSINKTKCMICSDKKIPFKGVNKYALKRHFCATHEEHGKSLDVNFKRRSDQVVNKKKTTGILSRGEYIQNCVMLAVFHIVPFILFNAKPFRNLTLIHALNTQLTINTANVGIFISLTAKCIRQIIMKEIKGKMISIKLDIATRHHRSVMGVNIQYYCRFRKQIMIRTLGIIELCLSHTSNYLQTQLYELLDVYGVNRRNIYSFTCDNGANMIRLGKILRRMQHDLFLGDELRKMQENIPDEEEDDQGEEQEEFQHEIDENFEVNNAAIHELMNDLKDPFVDGLMSILIVVRCAAHTLQLAVHDVLKMGWKSDIKKIRDVVKELKSSKYLNYMSKNVKTLKLNNATRWNSLFVMFESILEKRPELEEMYRRMPDKLKAPVYLDPKDFQLMSDFTEAFKPVFECTQTLQYEQFAMSKFFLILFEQIKLIFCSFLGDLTISWWRCKKAIEELHENENPFVKPLLEAFDIRGDELMKNPVLATAVYIDPRLHHQTSSPQLLGFMEISIEVKFINKKKNFLMIH